MAGESALATKDKKGQYDFLDPSGEAIPSVLGANSLGALYSSDKCLDCLGQIVKQLSF